MNASRASDPRVDARIVSFGSRAFCLDRVLDPKRPARALASRFPRLRVSRILLKQKPLGRDDADHGTPSHSSTRRVPRPRVARLALVTRAPPRLAPPPSCECMSRIDRYPASDGPKSTSRVSHGEISRQILSSANCRTNPIQSPAAEADLPSPAPFPIPQPQRQGWLRLQARPPQRQG